MTVMKPPPDGTDRLGNMPYTGKGKAVLSAGSMDREDTSTSKSVRKRAHAVHGISCIEFSLLGTEWGPIETQRPHTWPSVIIVALSLTGKRPWAKAHGSPPEPVDGK